MNNLMANVGNASAGLLIATLCAAKSPGRPSWPGEPADGESRSTSNAAISAKARQHTPLNSIYFDDGGGLDSPIAGGIGLHENFEGCEGLRFAYGAGCGQNGWSCYMQTDEGCVQGGFEIVNANVDPAIVLPCAEPSRSFRDYSARYASNGSEVFGHWVRSPLFSSQPGRIDADIVIQDAQVVLPDSQALFQIGTVNTAEGLFNTRVQFTRAGPILPVRTIEVLQATDCATGDGEFVTTGATWEVDAVMRIGIEVPGDGTLRVYKNDVLIFSGQDIAQQCGSGGPTGMNQWTLSATNADTMTALTVDNIGNRCYMPLPCHCRGDVFPPDGNGVVDFNDYYTVICHWGQTGRPNGPRPPGDCAPMPNGDCLVNVDDLLIVVNSFGLCPGPQPSSACPADIEPYPYGNESADVDDLLAVINGRGPCPPESCQGNIDNNCAVNVDDLLAVINAWGPCP